MNISLKFFEVFSVIVALTTTFLTIKQKSIRWPIDIIIILINLFIHHQVHLYDRWVFSAVIIVLDLYGWYKWNSTKNNKSGLKVKSISTSSVYIIISIGFIGMIIFYFFLIKINSDFPLLSSFRTIFSWIAIWLASNKRQENWFIWVILNFVSMYIYFNKALYFFSIKYIIYTFLCIYGYYSWQKSIDKQVKK